MKHIFMIVVFKVFDKFTSWFTFINSKFISQFLTINSLNFLIQFKLCLTIEFPGLFERYAKVCVFLLNLAQGWVNDILRALRIELIKLSWLLKNIVRAFSISNFKSFFAMKFSILHWTCYQYYFILIRIINLYQNQYFLAGNINQGLKSKFLDRFNWRIYEIMWCVNLDTITLKFLFVVKYVQA